MTAKGILCLRLSASNFDSGEEGMKVEFMEIVPNQTVCWVFIV